MDTKEETDDLRSKSKWSGEWQAILACILLKAIPNVSHGSRNSSWIRWRETKRGIMRVDRGRCDSTFVRLLRSKMARNQLKYLDEWLDLRRDAATNYMERIIWWQINLTETIYGSIGRCGWNITFPVVHRPLIIIATFPSRVTIYSYVFFFLFLRSENDILRETKFFWIFKE